MKHEDYHVVEAAFVEGFRQASDKRAFLQLARVPFEIDAEVGGLKLLEVKLDETFAVGAASPGFGSRELVYHPLPGEMIRSRNALSFIYANAMEARTLSLADALAALDDGITDGGHHHGHHHHHA